MMTANLLYQSAQLDNNVDSGASGGGASLVGNVAPTLATDPRYATPKPGTFIDPRFGTTIIATGPATTPSPVFTPPVVFSPPTFVNKPPATAADIRPSIPVITTSYNQDAQTADAAARVAAGISSTAKVTGVYGVADNNVYATPVKGTVQDPRYATPANPLGVRITTPTQPVDLLPPPTIVRAPVSLAPVATDGALNVNRVPSSVSDISSPAGGALSGPVQNLPVSVTTATAPVNWLPYVIAALVALILLRGRQ